MLPKQGGAHMLEWACAWRCCGHDPWLDALAAMPSSLPGRLGRARACLTGHAGVYGVVADRWACKPAASDVVVLQRRGEY